ncbi:MAG: sigma-70 family RNA polymerase sigma factor [Planctomycetes bacterium]|nr:sigma-70 family RNA polymerase sigma factor [Planctomycetota bacterium]
MSADHATPPLEALLAHREWVRSLARRLTDNAVDADDLEQDAWLAAANARPRDGVGIRAWFAKVMRNRAAERHRLDSNRGAREAVVARQIGLRSGVALVVDAEAHTRVVQAVLALNEPYRETVLLRFYEGLPPREVAAHMGIPVDTVKTRLRRAAEMLRDALGGRREDWLGAIAPLLDTRRGAPLTTATAVAGGIAVKLTTKAVVVALALMLVAGVAIRYSTDREATPEQRTSSANATPGPEIASPEGLEDRKPTTARPTPRETRRAAPPVLPEPAVTPPEPAPPVPPPADAPTDVPKVDTRSQDAPPPRGGGATTAAPGPAEMRVRVVDQRGVPRAGVQLLVGWATRRLDYVSCLDQVLDGASEVLVKGVEPGLVTVQLVVGGLRRVYRVQVAAGPAGDFEFVVPEGATVQGIVRHLVKGPLAGVTVGTAGAGLQMPEDKYHDILTATTDEHGRYRLLNVPSGDHFLSVTGGAMGTDSRARARVHVDGIGVVTQDIVLGAVSLAGIVTENGSGRPVAGARVRVSGWPWTKDASTDAVGRYQIVDLPSGTHSLQVLAEGFETAYQKTPAIEPERSAQLDVSLRRGSILELTLRDGAGLPVAGDIVLSVSGGSRTAPGARNLPSDERGVLRATHLPPGTWDLSVWTYGYEHATKHITLAAEGTTRATIALRPVPGAFDGPVITGRVIDETTQTPVVAARVWAPEGGGPARFTDAQGRFRVNVGKLAKYTVQVTKDGWGMRQVPVIDVDVQQGRNLEIALRPAATVNVRVRRADGAAYVGTFFLSFKPTGDGPKVGGIMEADAEGRATHRQAVPGSYRIGVDARDAGKSSVEREITPGENWVEFTLE